MPPLLPRETPVLLDDRLHFFFVCFSFLCLFAHFFISFSPRENELQWILFTYGFLLHSFPSVLGSIHHPVAGFSSSSEVVFAISLTLSLCWRSDTNGQETGRFLLLAPWMDHVEWVVRGTGQFWDPWYHSASCGSPISAQLPQNV